MWWWFISVLQWNLNMLQASSTQILIMINFLKKWRPSQFAGYGPGIYACWGQVSSQNPCARLIKLGIFNVALRGHLLRMGKWHVSSMSDGLFFLSVPAINNIFNVEHNSPKPNIIPSLIWVSNTHPTWLLCLQVRFLNNAHQLLFLGISTKFPFPHICTTAVPCITC